MNSPQLAQELWKQLWKIYRQRVSYARIYEKMIKEAGGHVANDHIAFRSLRLTVKTPIGSVNLGVPYLENIIQWLGYQVAGEYHFSDRHLYARHYRHRDQDEFDLPKIFLSELIVEQLPKSIAKLIEDTVRSGVFFSLSNWQKSLPSNQDKKAIASALVPIFARPWQPPQANVVAEVNKVSQYGAWVLLHGYSVNHFTGYINRQNTSTYPDIESTAKALACQGVPMKDSFEGGEKTGLRQTATEAIIEPSTVINEQGNHDQILWSYAYYELAQRYQIKDETGKETLFEGFIGTQARHLFEMTRTK